VVVCECVIVRESVGEGVDVYVCVAVCGCKLQLRHLSACVQASAATETRSTMSNTVTVHVCRSVHDVALKRRRAIVRRALKSFATQLKPLHITNCDNHFSKNNAKCVTSNE
jgi:hypothetical protein